MFSSIETLAINESKSVTLQIEDTGVLQQFNVLFLIFEEWKAANHPVASPNEYAVPLVVSYEDFAQHKFEATAELVLYPLHYMNHKTHTAAKAPGWMTQQFKIAEIRNIQFRKI